MKKLSHIKNISRSKTNVFGSFLFLKNTKTVGLILVIFISLGACKTACADSYATLLLHGDGTNGSTTFVDSSNSANPVTPSGTAKISTTQSKFGGSSMYFDGSDGARLTIPSSSSLDFGTGDFTIDTWIYPLTTYSFYAHIAGKGDAVTPQTYSLSIYTYSVGFYPYNGSINISANAWHHLAITRVGTTLRMFVDGALTYTGTNSVDYTSSEPFTVGDRKSGCSYGQYPFNGYIDELRISKGIARWTSNFTPSTSAYDTVVVSAPTVTTNTPSSIARSTATGNGNITSTGGENPTRSIEWGTVSGTYPNSCTAGTGSTGAYSCQLTNLTPNTTYYFRATATNSGGTSYGDEMTFTTLPTQVTIIAPDTTDMSNTVSSNYVTLNSGSITATPLVTANTDLIFQDTIFNLTVPQSTQITNTDTGNFNFQNFIVENASTTVRQTISNSKAAVKIGVPNTRLSFSQPITLSVDVDPVYNGQLMNVFYQNDGESTWHSQTSCTITEGKCNFTTTHATTYSVNGNGDAVGELGVNLNTDVQEVIALDCGTSIVNMGNLTPGTPVTGSSACLTTTNANGGYNLSVRRDDSTDTTMDKTTEDSTNITDKAAWNPTTPNATTWTGTGLGFTVYDSTANKNTTWWGTGGTVNDSNNLYAGFAPTQTDIMRHTAYSSVGTTTSIGYKLDVPPSQKSGAYSGAITYQVVTTP